ncbi:MAG: class I SAM-dependent methyltransferase [Delftia sp.]|nr:class I SAM-dependent methyltransferase [Delftia sp.]
MPIVLDMCCGPRMMWFDKKDSRAIYIDNRRERCEIRRPKRNTVEYTETSPDMLQDFTALPFSDSTFLHVVFDPPHFERDNPGSFMAKKYGTLSSGWREMIRDGFIEGFRVLKPGGTLIFKWTSTETPISEILKLTPEKALYGHKSGKQQRTHWVAFIKA